MPLKPIFSPPFSLPKFRSLSSVLDMAKQAMYWDKRIMKEMWRCPEETRASGQYTRGEE